MGHQACDALVYHNPGPDQQHAGVAGPKDEEEDRVEKDLHGVVGAGDQGEEPARGDGVLGGVGHLESCKYSVSLQLLVPGPEKDANQWHKEEKGGCWRCLSRCKARCFTYNPSSGAEVVGKADNVVGYVHRGLAGLVHCHTLIESAKALQRQKA